MAREGGSKAPGIRQKLLAEGWRFSFVQAFRLLRYLIRREMGGGQDESGLSRRIKVRPELSLDFPGTDITSIEQDPDQPTNYLLTATFFGLYGSSSPLPTFYTEELLQERNEDRSIMRDFLDIFNKPLYGLLFRTWGKYRLLFQLDEEQDRQTRDRLYCLLGLGGKQFRRRLENPCRLLRYTGLATQFPRSAEGLRAILADTLGIERLEVIGCIERMAPVPVEKRLVLGQAGNLLSIDTVLGRKVPDRMGKFRIRVGPVDEDCLHAFLPDGKPFGQIREIIGFYLDQPLDWELEIIIEPGQVRGPVLGEKSWSRLGWDTWLTSGDDRRQYAVCFESGCWDADCRRLSGNIAAKPPALGNP